MNKPAPVILSEAPALSLEGKHLPRPMKAQKTMHDPGRRAQREPSLARRRAFRPFKGGAGSRCVIVQPDENCSATLDFFSTVFSFMGLTFLKRSIQYLSP